MFVKNLIGIIPSDINIEPVLQMTYGFSGRPGVAGHARDVGSDFRADVIEPEQRVATLVGHASGLGIDDDAESLEGSGNLGGV